MATRKLLLAVSTFLTTIATAPAEAAQGPLGTSFNYYVWGNSIPALPIFYSNGAAVFTDYETATKIPHFIPVKLTFVHRQHPPPSVTGMGYSFLATPDTSAPMTPNPALSAPFKNVTLFIGSRSPESHSVGFANVLDPDVEVAPSLRLGGFVNVDGGFAVVEDDGRVKSSLFCAFPIKGSEGVWKLRWNVTSADGEGGGLPVKLRTMKLGKWTTIGNNHGTECRIMA